jgi:hypothetical protein
LEKRKLRFARKIRDEFSELSAENINVIVEIPDSTAFGKEQLLPIGR